MNSDAESTIEVSRSSRSAFDDDDEEEEENKSCAVCGDKATGYHFHAMTCEGCKAFFRRTVKMDLQFNCPYSQKCIVTKKNRRQCQACRFQKCLKSGMRSDFIMSDEAVANRRAVIKRRREKMGTLLLQNDSPSLTPQQSELIDCLFKAYQQYFISYFPKIVIVRDKQQDITDLSESSCGQHLSSASPDGSGQQSLSPFVIAQMAEINTFFTIQVINFAKAIPAFRTLPIEDQIILLKGSVFEVSEIISTTVFDVDTCTWDYGNDRFTIKDAIDAGVQQFFIEDVINFHKKLHILKPHETEYILMATLCIFAPDRPGLLQKDIISQVQEELAATLKAYIDQNYPVTKKSMRFPVLLSFLTELRSLNELHSKQILLLQEGLWTPLLKEVFS
ncbi:nuclear receptor subfamily 1 group I member 3-like isoform X1 [Protopterus annectens]|uniref:nuclear receptor subfamily 1 group I member 3-like isoform X1 n=1 Tax=Protopterus annectens TaxID=7888 RepID=UPI001CFBCE3B|nr:nuclear receptor subfamily 1 group I member 3-like isoform X1 [Protopterus annectens]